MKILARFENNDIEYVYYMDETYNIFFGVYDNGIIRNVNDKEKEYMENLLPYITISPNELNHIKIGEITYHSKRYSIYFDKISKFKYFKEIISNYETVPHFNDIKNLLVVYNSDILYLKEIEPLNDTKTHVFPYIKKTICASVITMSVFLLICPYRFLKIEKSISKLGNIGLYLQEGELTYSEFVRLVKSNSNLLQSDKEEIISTCDAFVKENSKYFINGLIASRLSDFLIDFNESNIVNIVLANYDLPENTINMNISKENQQYKETILHEMIHVFQDFSNLGRGIVEGTTEILSQEYMNNLNAKKYSYSPICYINKCLYEIVGTEPIMNLVFKGDYDSFIMSLMEIIPDENMAYEFLNHIDSIVCSMTDTNIDATEDKLKVLEYFEKYYYAKNNQDIKDNEILLYYLNQTGYYEDLPKARIVINGRIMDITKIEKPYFSKSLKKEYGTGVITASISRKVVEHVRVNESLNQNEVKKYLNDESEKYLITNIHYFSTKVLDNKDIMIMGFEYDRETIKEEKTIINAEETNSYQIKSEKKM